MTHSSIDPVLQGTAVAQYVKAALIEHFPVPLNVLHVASPQVSIASSRVARLSSMQSTLTDHLCTSIEGTLVGCDEGIFDGCDDGCIVGNVEGCDDGCNEGCRVGCEEGCIEGSLDGWDDGNERG